ncbi:triose-phosphate isomerase [Methanosphaerula palustris]|uniref:Triosephosphate isomerase n=1 Tax=Methanosphaerula palustris (strain ATCC BAA-1556 / DSM 19958 / E1-9c) TaxID=521011 RepID=B8GJJ7_METPE|nr:triose-phosphate isomerase [Methanosphaerula palustris]ACL17038.1 Triose-phosphate isomerase [Methanosphaerula palustris E1-9c]
MSSQFILVNLKAYKEGMGPRAHMIARAAEEVSEESGIQIGVAPSFFDLHPLSKHFEIPVFAQHLDGVVPGAFTGHVTAAAVRQTGAVGTLINHSERRLTLAEIEASVRAATEAGLVTVICSNNDMTSAAAAALSPTYVAIEPPELIGSGVSVAKADPGIIQRSVAAVHAVNPKVKVLTGAGIQSGECVKIARDLGTDGVLLASSVVKVEDPAIVLRDLVSLL